MRTRSVTVVVAALALSLSADVLACGDKFLVPGRGMRFKAKVNREAAAILLYTKTGTPLEQTLRALAVEAKLRAAGYRPTLVTTPDDFEAVLRSPRWDVVVVDLDGAASLANRLPAGVSPEVLPLTHNVPKALADVAKRRYLRIIDLSRKHQAWLDAIDEAVVARARSRAKTAVKSGV